MTRSRSNPIALTLLAAALLAVFPLAQAQQSPTPATLTGITPTTATSALPLAKVGTFSALLLDGGLLLHRLDGGSPSWLFAYGRHDGTTNFLHLSAFAGGDDTGLAIGSLSQFYRFSDDDVKTLTSFANGADLSIQNGVWQGLSKLDAYSLAADPATGALGTKLGAALILLDASSNLTETPTSLVATGARLCSAVEPIAHEVVRSTAVTSAIAASEGMESATHAITTTATTSFNSGSFTAKASLYCAGGWPPPPGTVPAFPPASPGFTPPTGTVVWSGTGCGVAGPVTSPCISSTSGQLCTCTCTGIGQGFSWKPIPASCGAIPVTPGPGAACSPVGGSGPCSNASGATCICPCTTGTGGGGVWGTPSSCPSGSAPLAALFALVAMIAAWRQRH